MNNHVITTTEVTNGYNLECECGWGKYAPKAGPDKEHPHRKMEVFAESLSERHLVLNGYWPYTSSGKPEQTVEGKVVPIMDWPFNTK